jgi:hypothetical protein
MNGGFWAPGKPSFTKPYCGKRGSAAMDPIVPSYSWDSEEEIEQSTKPKKYKGTATILEGMETSGVTGNRVLWLREVTATRQLKADLSLTVKATKPTRQWNIQE